jgi:hypothetical protein
MQRSAAQALEQQLRPLAPLLDELVLVGGAAVPLWVSAPGAPPARPTNDTDLIVATRSRGQPLAAMRWLRPVSHAWRPSRASPWML